jgi:hypothetical protein
LPPQGGGVPNGRGIVRAERVGAEQAPLELGQGVAPDRRGIPAGCIVVAFVVLATVDDTTGRHVSPEGRCGGSGDG